MTTISIYLDDGRVFEYEVSDAAKAREHMAAIVKDGYRHTRRDTEDLEWYPPHRIVKLYASGAGETTRYRDRIRAT